ncbi:LPXTG cell wall anchor domain-containing protein [Rhabdothermincola salaria]|uniref:LPXTG cell wall anchor domain-containing protein n=1 Tax=Rhabdothermincola salaria TaxID=2903142 RepID=UPI001E2A5926|nr:LPXTG cell wall anchor domain-containing protein [Rhabdothermincola salaria]
MTQSSSTDPSRPGWTDIRTIGPILVIVFGLVLLFTPLASVGASGSVGNAGAVFAKCPPDASPDECEDQGGGDDACAPGSIRAPGDCPEDEVVPEEECPTDSVGGVAFVAPDECPDEVGDEGAGPVEEDVVIVEDDVVIVEEVVVDGDGVEVVGAEEVRPATASAAPAETLPYTGVDAATWLSGAIGLTLVVGGSFLLVASRRRT